MKYQLVCIPTRHRGSRRNFRVAHAFCFSRLGRLLASHRSLVLFLLFGPFSLLRPLLRASLRFVLVGFGQTVVYIRNALEPDMGLVVAGVLVCEVGGWSERLSSANCKPAVATWSRNRKLTERWAHLGGVSEPWHGTPFSTWPHPRQRTRTEARAPPRAPWRGGCVRLDLTSSHYCDLRSALRSRAVPGK